MVILDNLFENYSMFTETFSGVSMLATHFVKTLKTALGRGGELSLENHESRKLFVEFCVSCSTVFLVVMFIS